MVSSSGFITNSRDALSLDEVSLALARHLQDTTGTSAYRTFSVGPGSTGQGAHRSMAELCACGRARGLRTCGGVVDVPPGHVGKPQARPQPQDTSATTRIPRSGATPAGPTPGAARAGPAGPGGARPLTPPRRLWRHQGESPPPAVGIALDALRPARLYAGSRVIPRVRVSRRGFGAQDGVITPVMTGKTPPRGPKPRTSAQGPVQAGTEAGSEDVLAPRG